MNDEYKPIPTGGWGIIHPGGGVSCMCILSKIKPMTKIGIAIRKYIRQYQKGVEQEYWDNWNSEKGQGQS